MRKKLLMKELRWKKRIDLSLIKIVLTFINECIRQIIESLAFKLTAVYKSVSLLMI